jgi:hypothetical protein
MKVEQISIFIENTAGRLAEVTRTIGEAGVNIRALSLADTSDFGILRLIVDQPALARSILRDHGFTVSMTDVVAVEVPDQPLGLYSLLDIFEKNCVNVEYMYAFVERSSSCAVMIFRFDNSDEAIRCLTGQGVTVLTGERVYNV